MSSHKKYLFVALLDNLVAGVAPHSQVLSVILNYQLRDLQGIKTSLLYKLFDFEIGA